MYQTHPLRGSVGLRPGRLPYMQISESLRRWKGRREGWTSGLEYASSAQGLVCTIGACSLKILQWLSIAPKSRDVPLAHGYRVIIANLEWLRLIRRHCEFHVHPARSFASPATAHLCTYLAACIEDRLT